MPCKHDFIITDQIPKGYCRCIQCLQTFPLGKMVEQLAAKIKHQNRIIEAYRADREMLDVTRTEIAKIITQQGEFEHKILALLTEPDETPVGDMKLAAAIEETNPETVTIVTPKKKRKKRKSTK